MPADELPQPRPDDRGLAVAGARELADQTVAAWTEFIAIAEGLDMDAPTRVKKTPVRAIIAKVGTWPQSRQLAQILADAQSGRVERVDQKAIDKLAVGSNVDRSKEELIAAVALSRDSLVDWLAGTLPDVPAFDDFALIDVGSPLGPLPIITYMHAGAFQLAVNARDLEVAGATTSQSLSKAGLRALVDTTGALAARMHITATFAVVTPASSVFTVSGEGGWVAGDIGPTEGRELAGIEGDIGVVLDIASGRKNPVRRLHQKEITVRDVPAMLRLAPIAHANPGLPGGPVLRKAASFLSVFDRG
ncbi:MAG: hypothetical protein WBB77_05410 [Candidatus Nanopelagicales bacterium]